jgi:hypothetical protein
VRSSRLHRRVGWIATVSGRTVRPLRVQLREWLLLLCRNTAMHFASKTYKTETALVLAKAGADVHCKANGGYGYSKLHRRVGLIATVSGRTVRPLRVQLHEWLLWLCRRTALHVASENGRTETAMALVKAGADVHGKDNDGYGSRGCSLVSVGLPQCRGGRSVHSGCSCTSGCFCYAG